jgi:hypothetical protein
MKKVAKTTKKTTSVRKPARGLEFVIVRAHTAGVHAGYLKKRVGCEVTLSNSIRLWRWCGASLSQVAAEGPAAGDNKFGEQVPETVIVSPQGLEIITCTAAAAKAIKAVRSWRK